MLQSTARLQSLSKSLYTVYIDIKNIFNNWKTDQLFLYSLVSASSTWSSTDVNKIWSSVNGLDLLTDLVPWQCSCRGTQRQLCYGSSSGVSVLGKMNRVVYSQVHISTVAPDYIEPSFLWSPSSSLAVYIPFQCQLWIAILSHPAHVAKVSKSSLLNLTVDMLAQLQSVC